MKGYCGYMINKKNTWSLADMKFLFSCSTRHLIRLLRSLVSYRVNHLKRNSISTHACVLFSIYYLVIIFKLLSQHIPVFFFVIDTVETSLPNISFYPSISIPIQTNCNTFIMLANTCISNTTYFHYLSGRKPLDYNPYSTDAGIITFFTCISFVT